MLEVKYTKQSSAELFALDQVILLLEVAEGVDYVDCSDTIHPPHIKANILHRNWLIWMYLSQSEESSRALL